MGGEREKPDRGRVDREAASSDDVMDTGEGVGPLGLLILLLAGVRALLPLAIAAARGRGPGLLLGPGPAALVPLEILVVVLVGILLLVLLLLLLVIGAHLLRGPSYTPSLVALLRSPSIPEDIPPMTFLKWINIIKYY